MLVCIKTLNKAYVGKKEFRATKGFGKHYSICTEFTIIKHNGKPLCFVLTQPIFSYTKNVQVKKYARQNRIKNSAPIFKSTRIKWPSDICNNVWSRRTCLATFILCQVVRRLKRTKKVDTFLFQILYTKNSHAAWLASIFSHEKIGLY